jgi:hypothetical protein
MTLAGSPIQVELASAETTRPQSKCFISVNKKLLLLKGYSTIAMDCHDVPIMTADNNNYLELGGVSGGPIRDSSGNVVGLFTGSIGLSRVNPSRWFLVGTPLFIDFENSLRPYPYPNTVEKSYIDLQCFEFFSDNGPTIEQILEYPIEFQYTCRVLNGHDGLEFQLID